MNSERTEMEYLRIERREGGVAVVLLDCPGQPHNTLGPELIGEVETALGELLSEGGVRALVIGSAKEGSFIAGADLKVLDGIEDPEEAAAISRRGNELLQRLANSPKPSVAAVDGPALGGGFEVALACSYILATGRSETVLGLPEVQLGLLPGAGGMHRTVARAGLSRALPLLLQGKRLRARKAKKLGLVDGLTTPGGLVESAVEVARKLADGELRPPTSRHNLLDRAAKLAPVRELVLKKAREQVDRQTRGNYPAPHAILDCVEVGQRDGLAAGLRTESHRFGQLVASPQAKGLISLFQGQTALKKEAQGDSVPAVRRLAVLGGGFMGSGIASVSLGECPVVLRDLKAEVLDEAVKDIHGGLVKQKRSYAIDQRELERRLSRLQPTTDVDAIRGADLVIEAVFEDLELKRKVLAEAEARIAADAVFASNTSALPIAQIARDAQHPERVLGMHYFSPVPKMPLLEVVVHEGTAGWALDRACAFGAAQGKTVIVVKDGPGFYTTRILAPYINEAMLLIGEGARIEDLDRALKDFGFPVGPVALFDEVGIDVGAHISETLGEAFAERFAEPSPGVQAMHEAGYQGRKNRKGFYRYPKKGRKKPNPDAYRFFGEAPRRDFAADELQERLVLLMVNEAAHCLGEGIVDSARDADIGAVFGLGFAPFTGGPLRWVDRQGPQAVVDRMRQRAERLGPRFAPAPALVDLAEGGGRFHG